MLSFMFKSVAEYILQKLTDTTLLVSPYISLISDCDEGIHLKDGQFKKCLLT